MGLTETALAAATGALFLITMGFAAVTTIWLSIEVRRQPPELLQLRVYRNHRRLTRGLLGLGVGTVAGVLAFLPSQLIPDPLLAQAWTFAWLVPWAAALSYGIFALLRSFGPAPGKGGP